MWFHAPSRPPKVYRNAGLGWPGVYGATLLLSRGWMHASRPLLLGASGSISPSDRRQHQRRVVREHTEAQQRYMSYVRTSSCRKAYPNVLKYDSGLSSIAPVSLCTLRAGLVCSNYCSIGRRAPAPAPAPATPPGVRLNVGRLNERPPVEPHDNQQSS